MKSGNVMRKSLLASVGLAAMLAGPAIAADMRVGSKRLALGSLCLSGIDGLTKEIDQEVLVAVGPKIARDPS